MLKRFAKCETIKGVQIEKEDIKLSLLTDDMIIYVENLKELTQNSCN